MLWRIASFLWDVAYLKLPVESLITHSPNVHRIDRKIPGLKRSIVDVLGVEASTRNTA